MSQKPITVQITAAIGLILALSIAAYAFANWNSSSSTEATPTPTPLVAYPAPVSDGEPLALTQQVTIDTCGVALQYPDDWVLEKTGDSLVAFFSKEDNIALVERLRKGDVEGFSLSSLSPDTEDKYPTDYKSTHSLLSIHCSSDLKDLRAEYAGFTSLSQIEQYESTPSSTGMLNKVAGSVTIDEASGIAINYFDPYTTDFGMYLKPTNQFILFRTSDVEGSTFSPTLNAVLQSVTITR